MGETVESARAYSPHILDDESEPYPQIDETLEQARAYYRIGLDNELAFYLRHESKSQRNDWSAAADTGLAGFQWLQGMYELLVVLNKTKGLELIRSAAEKQDLDALSCLGDQLFRDNWEKSESEVYYEAAAKQGHSRAQYELGEWLLHVLLDKREAWDWIRKSAEQGFRTRSLRSERSAYHFTDRSDAKTT